MVLSIKSAPLNNLYKNQIEYMKKLFTLLAFSFLISCSQNHSVENEQPKATNSTDTGNQEAVNTIINFYKWYRNHLNIQQCLVNNECNDDFDSTKFYSVNFAATENYLTTLKNTGYISDTYISNWRKYFKKCDDNFQKNPVNEGPPDGFEYDFITNSQDSESELNSVEKAKVFEVINSNDKKIITLEFITGTKLTFDMTLINNKWFIDKIK